MDNKKRVEAEVAQMKEYTQFDVDQGYLQIDSDNVMRPIRFKDEMERKLRNRIAWCQSHRRADRKKIGYFQGLPEGQDVEHIIIQIEAEVDELDELEKLYKEALEEVRNEDHPVTTDGGNARVAASDGSRRSK